ncbi:MAG: hypothetical protein ACPHEP_02935 [Acidimicrobiales bacterium]
MLRNRMGRASLAGSQFDATRLRLDTGEGRNGLIDIDGGYLRTSYGVPAHQVEDVYLFNSGRNLAVIARVGGSTSTAGGIWVFKLGEPYNFLNHELVGFMSGSLSENNPTSVWMSDDGTKLAWTGRSTDRVRIGTCTTPYDPSTVSSIISSGSLNNSSGSLEGAPRALEVHPSGTKFWIWGRNHDSILEFNTFSAWVPYTTTRNADVTFSTASQTTSIESIRWADSGTKLYITNNLGYVWRYNAGSAYSISSLTNQTSTNTVRILANGNTHQGSHFNNRIANNFEVLGTGSYVTRIAAVTADTMYVAISDQEKRNHFPLEMISMEMTTNWDEETLQVNPTAMRGIWRAGQTNGSQFNGFDFMEQSATANSVYKDGGARLYTLEGGGTIKQFHLDAPYALSGYGGTPFQSADISSIVGTNLRDLWVRPNGLDFYILTPTHIRKLRASTNTDVTTLSLNESLTHGFASTTDPCFLWISPDGTKVAVGGSTNSTGYTGDLRVWTLSTAFNLNSASLTYSVSMGAGGDPCAMAWSPDGTRLIWASTSGTDDRIIVDEYELSTAWNAATKGSAREASKIQLTRDSANGSLMRWNTRALGGSNSAMGGRSLIVSGGYEQACLYTMTTY